MARAATKVNVPYTMSSAAASSIEEAAEASGEGKRFFQLYWPSNERNDLTASMLKRAKDAGFEVSLAPARLSAAAPSLLATHRRLGLILTPSPPPDRH